jgi:hypothetical protein
VQAGFGIGLQRDGAWPYVDTSADEIPDDAG